MSSSKPRNRREALLQTAVIAVVVASVLAALLLVGSPAEQRRRRIDSRRVSDLESIAYAVRLYYDRNKQLPESLEQLRNRYRQVPTTDLQTKQPYTYRALTPREYELGAVFERATTGENDGRRGDGYTDRTLPFWKHPAGYATFRLDVTAAGDEISRGKAESDRGNRWT
jgi:type II secretory pathway pseudopilin PulG